MSCLCKAGRFSYGESPRTPPLEGTSLHRRNISVERPWGILSLFTTCLPLWVKSSHQSRCHTSPTQELIACILRRQSSPIYGVLERTEPERKKSAGEEDRRKSPEKIKKNEPLEKLKSTESLKRERPSNKPPKRTKYIKTSLQRANNRTPKNRKAKERARAEKANKCTGSCNALNRTESHQTRTEWKMAKGNKREITWCFMPSISGRGESEKSTISKKKLLKINK